MIKRAMALRYSKALFNENLAPKKLEERLENFAQVCAICKKNPDLVNFLKAPQIDLEEKKKVLHAIFQDRLDAFFYHFLFYIVEKQKLSYLHQIAFEYRLMVNQQLGIWEAKIITAIPIEPEIENVLKAKLEKFYHKKIKLYKEIDPKILGGAILIVANEMIDWSVRERLKKMKDNLMASRSENGF